LKSPANTIRALFLFLPRSAFPNIANPEVLGMFGKIYSAKEFKTTAATTKTTTTAKTMRVTTQHTK
jgi:hypothetical protein